MRSVEDRIFEEVFHTDAGGEEELFTIGGPFWRRGAEAEMRQLHRFAAVEVQEKDLGFAVGVADEGDLLAVGAPGRL